MLSEGLFEKFFFIFLRKSVGFWWGGEGVQNCVGVLVS